MTVPPHPRTPYQITHPHLHTTTLLIHPYDLCLFSLETGYRDFSLTFLTRFVFIGSGSDEWRGQIERRSRLAHRASNYGGGLLVHSRKRFLARKKESMLASDSVVLPLVLKKLTKNLDKIMLPVTFVDKERTEVRLKMKKGPHAFTRVVVVHARP